MTWQDKVVEMEPTRHYGLVFISAASKGIVKPVFSPAGGPVSYVFHEDFLRTMAELRRENPHAEFFSPSLQNYMLLPYMPEASADYESWKIRCRIAIEASAKVLILPFKGWQTSVGVNDEVQWALSKHIQVEMDIARPCYQ